MRNVCLMISILFLLTGCASKRFTKQAARFEQAGLYEDAANYYYEAVKRKDTNVEAKLGLRKNGQLTLEEKLADFMKAYNGANSQDAVYTFKEAESYYSKLKAVGIELNFPDSYHAYYDEAKGDFLNKKYADGLDKLNREDFSGARKVFDEIIKIDPNYKDVKEKNTIARYEPLYREAGQMLENGLYRKAYYKFNEILTGTGGYKQSDVLKEEALKKGTITIFINDFTATKNLTSEVSNAITAKVKSRINTSRNPFVRIIDQPANNNIYEKGKINLQAANLAGIKAVLSGNINEMIRIDGNLFKTVRRGFRKEVLKEKNEAGQEIEKIIWHKIEYTEFEIENKSKLSLYYKLVSTENGMVLLGDVITINKSDKAHYAKYDGEKKNLVPGYWKYKDQNSPEDVIKNNQGDINDLKNLFSARQTVKTTSALAGELMDEGTERIAQKVENYNPESK